MFVSHRQKNVCVAEFRREHHERAAGLVRLRQGGAERLGQPGHRGDAAAHLCPQRYGAPTPFHVEVKQNKTTGVVLAGSYVIIVVFLL